VGWILDNEYKHTETEKIRDFAKYPELRWLNRFHLVPPVALAAALFAIGGAPLLVWGFFVSTVLLWHGTFTINSLAHVFGRRRYETTDDSRNSMLLALITMGEGWHNNHHYYQRSASQGFRWYELDMSYLILRALQAVGVVSGVGKPPAHVIAGERAPAAQGPRSPAPAAARAAATARSALGVGEVPAPTRRAA
jgi:stearoyl-CoA desaturase (Delta-9 desaturase)